MPFNQSSLNFYFLLISFGLPMALFNQSSALADEYTKGKNLIKRFAHEPIHPIPQIKQENQNHDVIELGRKLFMDPRLSINNSISCASCHPLDNAGVDGLKFPVGFKGAIGKINTPTVFNSSLNFVLFYDGRASNLEDQMDDPIHNPQELNSNWEQIIAKLLTDNDYNSTFLKLYPQGITQETVKNAVATFERSLNTPNARFDKFLRGEKDAISKHELKGYILFKNYGCSSCHQGKAVGGNMYEKMGVHRDYFTDRGNITKADYGRFNVTGIDEHRFEFKVPSLRNVALTSPYFHDGSKDTLEEAVKIMAKYQLGRDIKPDDVKSIVAFLKTLTGEFKQ